MADRPEDLEGTATSLDGEGPGKAAAPGSAAGKRAALDEEAMKLTSDELGPALGMESVLMALDTSGQVGSGADVSLRRLAEDEALPEIKKGRERYQVLKTLGEGGMGKVHLVADRDLKRRVAMKVIRAHGRITRHAG